MIGELGFVDREVFCVIGDLPEEREKPQRLFVTVHVRTEWDRLVANDKLSEGVDYTTLYQLVEQVGVEGKYRLLETYAAKLMESILILNGVLACMVFVKKPGCLPNASYAFVKLNSEGFQ